MAVPPSPPRPARPTTAPRPVTPPRPEAPARTRVRLIGLLLGALVGAAVTALLLLVGVASGIAAGGSLDLLVGPDGLFAPERGARYVWVVPPIAASGAGAIVAPWAARRTRWAGAAMGFMTYLIGIGIGPLFVLVLPDLGAPPTVGSVAVSAFDGLLSVLFGVGVLWFIGAVILAPLLLACVVGGIAWAAALRGVVGDPGAPAPPPAAPRPLVDAPLIVMVVVASVLGLLWLLLVAVLQVLADAQSA